MKREKQQQTREKREFHIYSGLLLWLNNKDFVKALRVEGGQLKDNWDKTMIKERGGNSADS